MNPPREIHLHIERIVLEGLPMERSQGAVFTTALEAELTNVLTGIEWPARADCAHAVLIGDPIQMKPRASHSQTTGQIAQVLLKALTQTASLRPLASRTQKLGQPGSLPRSLNPELLP
ncbi:MAG TPA: hypothetical protein VGO11_23485 [Chthoniobacteraceae bacterium]|jgi:hypothetical protein|nr:hypothetical protein [Chthoniobacteraceae bacterium]